LLILAIKVSLDQMDNIRLTDLNGGKFYFSICSCNWLTIGIFAINGAVCRALLSLCRSIDSFFPKLVKVKEAGIAFSVGLMLLLKM
jgi:hypothetical protein